MSRTGATDVLDLSGNGKGIAIGVGPGGKRPAYPSTTKINSANSTNSTLVQRLATTLFAVNATNNGGAAAFVKLYDKATAPVVGIDVPVLVVPVPAAGVVSLNMGDLGSMFSLGLGIAITNLIADSDTTAVAANQVKVSLSYL